MSSVEVNPVPASSPRPDLERRSADDSTGDDRPVVWLVLSDKAGDNAQVLAVAEALPWPHEIKRLFVVDRYALGKPTVAASLHHIDAGRSDALQPPWPDLLITVGRRMSMVALWIQEQSAGRTKIVLLGTPKRFPGRFDLAIISEQYRQPPRPNFLRIRYPLQKMDKAAIAAEAEDWHAEFGHLRRPLIAVMVGGLTKAVRFDAAVAARLARDVGAYAERTNGALFVTTSRRTPAEVVAALERELPESAILHRWRPNETRNPYRALLGLADRFIITSDSLSMQMEVARLGRPLAIYPLPPSSRLAAGPLSALIEGRLDRILTPKLARRLERRLGGVLDRLGALRHHRDLAAIPRRLVKDRYAVWFGEAFLPEQSGPGDELPEVVARILTLMRERSSR
jgi:mitochondrial fission protein ELM1